MPFSESGCNTLSFERRTKCRVRGRLEGELDEEHIQMQAQVAARCDTGGMVKGFTKFLPLDRHRDQSVLSHI
jgi:hypothetical protein